jgi:hypothetical protein
METQQQARTEAQVARLLNHHNQQKIQSHQTHNLLQIEQQLMLGQIAAGYSEAEIQLIKHIQVEALPQKPTLRKTAAETRRKILAPTLANPGNNQQTIHSMTAAAIEAD